MRPQQLLAAALTLSSLSAAWPWPPNVDDMKAVMGIENLFKRENWLYVRQDNNDNTSECKKICPPRPPPIPLKHKKTPANLRPASSAAAKTTDSKSDTASASNSEKTTAAETASKTGTDSAAATTGGSSNSGSGTNTASQTGKTTGSATGSGTKTSKKGSKSTSYDARLPAGGISMITPAATDSSQYYKIGDWVSFAWNYTSLSATPSAINVLASCSKNQETYTLAQNMSVHETNMVFWDTGEYQKTATKSLIQETYTLIVYDAGSSISATAAAGYLGVANTFQFAMYSPQPYTPRSGEFDLFCFFFPHSGLAGCG